MKTPPKLSRTLSQVIIKLDRKTHRSFKVKTARNGTSMASVIREMVDRYLLS